MAALSMQRQRKSVQLVDEVKNLEQESLVPQIWLTVEKKIPCQGILTVHRHSNLLFTGTDVLSATGMLGFTKECNVLTSMYFAYCARNTRVP